MAKAQNLLLVTEHYPCGFQEAFLETEIEYLTRLYNVHVITTDTDRLMTRALPRGVTFSRPAEHTGSFKRALARLKCLFSHGYKEERRWAKKEGRWTKEFQKHTLDSLVESRLLYDYVRGLDVFQDERPLTIYSANMNNYLYGLCCLKVFNESGIKVLARCHRANMLNPVTEKRRDTLNHIINEAVDTLYFTNEGRRDTYNQLFCHGESEEVLDKLRIAPLGVPGPEKKERQAPDEFLLQLVSCSPIEEDKRLDLLIEGIAGMEHGVLEWVHIGDGSQREKILALAQKKLGKKPGVRYHILGRMNQQERYRWYAETPVDALISVSRSESVPSAMLEAMANHVFVCATAVDGVTDVVNGDCGLLLPPEPTPEQLSRFLEALCGMNKELFRLKSEQAFKCWRESFSADKNCVDFVRELAGLPFGETVRELEEKEAPEPEAAKASVRRTQEIEIIPEAGVTELLLGEEGAAHPPEITILKGQDASSKQE